MFEDRKDELAERRAERAYQRKQEEILNGIADDVVMTAVADILRQLQVDPATKRIRNTTSVTYAVQQIVLDISDLTRVEFIAWVRLWLWRVLEDEPESLSLSSPDPNDYIILEYRPKQPIYA